jgi:hypothetical protein
MAPKVKASYRNRVKQGTLVGSRNLKLVHRGAGRPTNPAALAARDRLLYCLALLQPAADRPEVPIGIYV